MNKNLLFEIKRINQMMGNNKNFNLLLETDGKAFDELIKKTIGWEKVGEFFDDVFEGTGRKTGKLSSQEAADILQRQYDNDFATSYDNLVTKSKKELQDYSDSLIKKLRRGATNLTKEELALKKLLEKVAKLNDPVKLTKNEVEAIKEKAINSIADKPQYKNLIDNDEGTGIIDDVTNEIEEKIANGENPTIDDIDKLISDKIDNVRNKNGQPLDPRVAAKLKQKSKSNIKYKNIVNKVKENAEFDEMADSVTRNVTGEVEKLPDDLAEIYKKILNKLNSGEELDELEKKFKESVDNWKNGTDNSFTNIRSYGDAITKNETAFGLLTDENQRLFQEAGISSKSFVDKTNEFIDWFLGKSCKNKQLLKSFCKAWNFFFETTGIEFFIGIFQNLLKSLDDIIVRVDGKLKISYSRLSDVDLFQQQYKEILNGMQKIAAEKRKGWEQALQFEQIRLVRLIKTRRPAPGIDAEQIATEYKNTFLNAIEELRKKLVANDNLPGVKALSEWMSQENTKNKDGLDILEDAIRYLKLAYENGDGFFRTITPLMNEVKVKADYIRGKQEEAAVEEATQKLGKESEADSLLQKFTKTQLGNFLKNLFSRLINFFGNTVAGSVSNWLRYGLFTNLNAFETVLAKYGYIAGLAVLYCKLVVSIVILRMVGFFVDLLYGLVYSEVYDLTKDLTTTQLVMLFITHPFETFKAQVYNDRGSQKFLYLKFDEWRKMKENLGKEFTDVIFDPKNLTVIPIIEEIMKVMTAFFNLGNNYKRARSGEVNDEIYEFNSDISAINPGTYGSLPPIVVSEIVRLIGNYTNRNSNIYDVEEGIQKQIDELKEDLGKLKNQNLKEFLGEDYEKMVKEYKQKKFNDLIPYFDSGCLGQNATFVKSLLEQYYDVNPKYLKPFNPAKTTEQNGQNLKTEAQRLEYRIRELKSTDETEDEERKNFDVFGFFYDGEMYWLQKGPFLRSDKGQLTYISEDSKNIIRNNSTLGNAKCCTMYDYYIAKENTNIWYCIASSRLPQLFGGKKNAEQKIKFSEDTEAKQVFDKITKLVQKILNNKTKVDIEIDNIKFWIETYKQYKNEPNRYKSVLAGSKQKMGDIFTKIKTLKEEAIELQNLANKYIYMTESRKTEGMENERKTFFENMKNLEEFGVNVKDNRLDLNDIFVSNNELLNLLNSIEKTNESRNIYYNKSSIINEIKNMKARYLFEDEKRFGENKFDHWYDTFTFEKFDEKSNEFKEIETDSLKHGKIKDRFNDFIKRYDGDDAFVRAVVDTHPEVVRFRYLKDQADINESYVPVGLGMILQSIREAKGGEYEIFSVSRQDGNWNIVKGNFTKKEMANMVLSKEIPAEKQPKKRENGLESLKKKEGQGTTKLKSNEKEGLDDLPKRIKDKLKEKMQKGWSTETPPSIFSEFYDESEIKSVFNDEIKIYKLNPTKEFFNSLEKNSSHVIVKRGFCRSLTLAKKDTDMSTGQKNIVRHILTKCNHKFNNKLGLKYTTIR